MIISKGVFFFMVKRCQTIEIGKRIEYIMKQFGDVPKQNSIEEIKQLRNV
jgi:hypothetical protein